MRARLNVPLKIAIIESQRKQKTIARAARLSEVELSRIVRGRRRATPDQRERLAAVLARSEAELFPDAVSA